MTDIAPFKGGGKVEQFDPERYRLKQAAFNYTIEEAKRIKDWPKLEEAVDLKIDEQCKFVAWREANMRGAGQPKKNSDRSVGILSSQRIEQITGISERQAERIAIKLEAPDNYRVRLLGAAYQAAMLEAVDNVRGTGGTGKNEWFTPKKYIELARAVLGEIDLDPATHRKAQETIRAKKFFTKEDDGLKHEWHGRVWLNPPYARRLIADFVSKMCTERKAGRVSAAIMLTHNLPTRRGFKTLRHRLMRSVGNAGA